MRHLHGALRDEMSSTLKYRPSAHGKLTWAEYIPFVILSVLFAGLVAGVAYLIY